MASFQERSDALVSAKAVSRTYTSRVYEDPWEAVKDYRQVASWAEENPQDGATSIGKRFDLPRGRVEPWLNDSKPNSVRGIEVAEDHGWINPDPGTETFRGLNALVAWILQSGSITKDTWVPFFTVGNERDRELLNAAARLAGTELDVTRSASALRSQEMRPVEHGSVLGRILVVLGAPQGAKRDGSEVRLPDYLNRVPDRLAQEFVQLFIHNLGRSEDDRYYIHLRPSLPERYLNSVAELVREQTGEMASVIGQNVILSKPASRKVALWEPLLDVE